MTAIRRAGGLAALAMLLTMPWAMQQAAAHPYWPQTPTVTPQPGKKVNGATVYTVKVKVVLQKPPPRDIPGLTNNAAATMGLNWCRAKAALPAGWNTQDDRSLRTGSMCQEPPFYGSLGQDYPHKWGETGTKNWTTPDNYSFSDGRYIFSINIWTAGAHHAGGNHTTLHLVNVNVPD